MNLSEQQSTLKESIEIIVLDTIDLISDVTDQSVDDDFIKALKANCGKLTKTFQVLGNSQMIALCLSFANKLQSVKTTEINMENLSHWPTLLYAYVIDNCKQNYVNLFRFVSSFPLVMECPQEEVIEEEEEVEIVAEESLATNCNSIDYIEERQENDLEIKKSSVDLPNFSEVSIDTDTLALLQTAIGDFQDDNQNAIAALFDVENIENWQNALKSIKSSIDTIISVLNSVDLLALESWSYVIQQEIERLTPEQIDVLLERLQSWVELSVKYLNDPSNEITTTEMLEVISVNQFVELNPEQYNNLKQGLLSLIIEESSINQKQSNRIETITFEEVSLKVPDDINPDLLESLLQELPGQTSELGAAIYRLTSENSPEDLIIAQRIAHTLKGSANVVGIRGLANLTHFIEDIFDALSKFKAMPGPNLSKSLIEAVDCLESVSDALLGIDDAPPNLQQVATDILNWATHIEQNDLDDNMLTSEISETPTDDNQNNIVKTEVDSHILPNLSTQQITEKDSNKETTTAISATTNMLRVSGDTIDDLLKMAGESTILNGQLSEQLGNSIDMSFELDKQNQIIEQSMADLERLITISGSSKPDENGVKQDNFDSLEMEQYNEVHSRVNQLMEMVTDTRAMTKEIDAQFIKINSLVEAQRQLNKENQEEVLKTRQISVETIVPRLQRGVRQASRLTGKSCVLNIKGEQTKIDGAILNELVGALLHLLRNAVDHGIETSEVRLASGKSETGTIDLSFYNEGNDVIISCIDDGIGLNAEKITHTAIQRGLLKEGEELPYDELGTMVLTPGFTTKDEATHLSGRGIGMDSVSDSINKMKGSFKLDSTPGLGCQINIQLPASWVSSHALLVKANKTVVTVLGRGIDQIIHQLDGQIKTIGNKSALLVGKKLYQFISIESLLNMPTKTTKINQNRPVLLLEDSQKTNWAVSVQEVIDGREIVVKKLGRYVPKSNFLTGATILGDGSISPVIDLTQLLTNPEYSIQLKTDSLLTNQSIEENTLSTILVVDDSLSARRTLAQLLRDAGFNVVTAIDGQQAFEIIQQHKPDIVLTDLEMPRMNGIELTHRIKSMKDYKDLPIIMITSRTTERHRELAEAAGVKYYMSKPYAEDLLLERVEKLVQH